MDNLSMRAARTERGYTQEAIAEVLGINKRTYIAWELGEVPIKPYMMYSIAYVLEMDVDKIRVPDKQ